MWKSISIFFAFIALGYCQNNSNISLHKRKPHYDPYYHHLFYGGGLISYLTFIIVKIKVVFIIGTILTVLIFAGKFIALIKYIDYTKSEHHHKPEKIYIQAPSHHGHDHGPISYSPPMNSYSSGYTVDKLPPNAEIAGGPGGFGGNYYDSPPPHAYGRNYESQSSIYEYYRVFTRIIKKSNLTDIAFNSMKVKSNECKKKFVCNAEFVAKYSYILSTALHLFRDNSYDKYKTNATVTSLEGCAKLYPNCQET